MQKKYNKWFIPLIQFNKRKNQKDDKSDKIVVLIPGIKEGPKFCYILVIGALEPFLHRN